MIIVNCSGSHIEHYFGSEIHIDVHCKVCSTRIPSILGLLLLENIVTLCNTATLNISQFRNLHANRKTNIPFSPCTGALDL